MYCLQFFSFNGIVLLFMVKTYVAKNRKGEIFTDEIGLNITAKGISLPCGNTTIWKCDNE